MAAKFITNTNVINTSITMVTTTKMVNTNIMSRRRCKQKPRWSPARERRSPGRWGTGCHSRGQYCGSQKHEISSFTGQGSDLGDPEVCGHRPHWPRSQDCLRCQHWRLRAASGKYILHSPGSSWSSSSTLWLREPLWWPTCLPATEIQGSFPFYTLFMSVAGSLKVSICFGPTCYLLRKDY